VNQISGGGVDQSHTEFNEEKVSRGNASPEQEEKPQKTTISEKAPAVKKDEKPQEKKKPVILEITQDKKESDTDGGVARGNAPKTEFSGPPDQGDKDETVQDKPKEQVKTEVMPVQDKPKEQVKTEVKPAAPAPSKTSSDSNMFKLVI
jgi:hypothetical protein